MPLMSCPGAARIKDPVPEFFECPKCKSEVEIWTHEHSRQCKNCGQMVFRNQLPSCIEWCEYGKECVGEEAYNRYMDSRKAKAEDKVGREVEEARMKELIEKIKEKCERRNELDGEKTDN